MKRRIPPLLSAVVLLVVILLALVWYRNDVVSLYSWAQAAFSVVDRSEESLPALEVVSAAEKPKKLRTEKVRGDIYDRNFKALAMTVDRVSVYARPRELEDLYSAAGQISAILGLNEQELTDNLATDAQRVWIMKNVSVEEEAALQNLNLSGVYFHREDVRYYPYKGVAAHVLGYADHNMGLAGVEHSYNRLLDQVSISQEDFPLIDLEGRSRTGVDGQHLVLTMDLKIQDYLEKYVASLASSTGKMEVACLLMETDSGAIVANAQTPSFDPNLYYQYEKKSLNALFFQQMVIPEVLRRFFLDAAQLLSEQENGKAVLPWSVAAGIDDTGFQLRLWEKIGLGTPPKFDFSMTSSTERVDGGGTIVPLMQQGESGTLPLMASPMQMLMGLVYLVNGGHLTQPHVCGRIIERSGEREYFYKPPGMNKVGIDDHPATKEIRSLLKAGRPQGPLESMFVDAHGLSLLSESGGSSYQRSGLTFSLLPSDKPELVLVTLVRKSFLEPSPLLAEEKLNPTAPLVKMLPTVVALQQVHKNIADMMTVSEKKASNFQQKQEEKKTPGLQAIIEKHEMFMPDMVGLSMRRALRLLQNTPLKVRVQGTGRVVAQSPPAGAPLDKVKECQLTLQRDEKDARKGVGAVKSGREEKKKGNQEEKGKGEARAH